MLRLINQFAQMPIRSLHTGQQIGMVSSPIINPDNLFVPAFFCKAPGSKADLVVNKEDIIEVNQMGLIVNSDDALMPLNDLVRLQKVVKLNFELINKPVYTDSKKRIGKVSDYVIDDQTFEVQKIYVKRSIIKDLSTSILVIGRPQIIEVTDRRVIVKDTEIKQNATEPAVSFSR